MRRSPTYFGRENMLSFSGPAGTAFLENTYGIHRGVPPKDANPAAFPGALFPGRVRRRPQAPVAPFVPSKRVSRSIPMSTEFIFTEDCNHRPLLTWTEMATGTYFEDRTRGRNCRPPPLRGWTSLTTTAFAPTTQLLPRTTGPSTLAPAAMVAPSSDDRTSVRQIVVPISQFGAQRHLLVDGDVGPPIRAAPRIIHSQVIAGRGDFHSKQAEIHQEVSFRASPKTARTSPPVPRCWGPLS